MNEWFSTNDARYWRHRCGRDVLIINGHPSSHRCPEDEDGWWDGALNYNSSFGSDGRCVKCAATVKPQDSAKHNSWHREVEKGIQMAAVRWCDIGDHPFKASAPGSQSMDVKQVDANGMEQSTTMDVCGEHAFGTNNDKTLRAIEKSYEETK